MNARQGNRPRPINKPSSLLTKEENELVFSVLGKKCVSLATSVVQVFMTEPPNHLQWVKQYCGAVCLVKDNPRHSYFIRIVDIDKHAMIWDQELYDQFEYKVPMPFFHTFESDSCQTGLNFADENEANCFKIAVQTKLRQWQQRQEKKRSQQSLQPTSKGIPGQISGRRAESLPSLHNAEKKKKDRKKQKLSKADIGFPTDFIHIQHVGWDRKDLDFDISQSEELDPQLRSFFKIAGVSEKDLADKSTRNFIYDFIDKNGGLNVIRGASKPSGQAPPVPARDASAAHHHPSPAMPVRSAAPLPPSTRSAAPPPPIPPPPNRAPSTAPPPLPTSNKPSLLSNTSVLHTPPQIPATAMRVPPPPPPPCAPCPPPPPPPAPCPPPPPPPPPPSDMPPVSNARAALLDGIRKGISLNPVVTNGDTPKSSSPSDGRDALLNQIRQGIELRPVSEEVKNTPAAPPLEGLAGALASALQERARAMHQTDESDSDEDELDDEWDD